jgi:hypothetical protein
MMLQSHEGIIRVFPAWPIGVECKFTLKAAGNFMVSSACKSDGASSYVIIRSLSGGRCLINVPFLKRGINLCNAEGETVDYEVINEDYLSFMVEKLKTYVIYAQDINPDEIAYVDCCYYANSDSKEYNQAKLGRKRMF